jgi:hypothetical protein
MTPDIPESAAAFVSELAALQPNPVSIWLIGSRANGRATERSDTDFIVFGSQKLINEVKSRLMQPELVDCLIVYDNDNYQDPWQEKRGSLTNLKWHQIDNFTAIYTGFKWIPDEEKTLEFDTNMGSTIHLRERALRVWPLNAIQ